MLLCMYTLYVCVCRLNVCMQVQLVCSLVPRPRPAFRRLQYGKAVEGLE